MQIADRIRADVTTAMKAGERDRVAALRLVLSELQKAAKEGDARRGGGPAARAQEAPRGRGRPTATAGRDEQADGRGVRGGDDRGLPARRARRTPSSTSWCAAAVEATGASSPRDMGRVIKHVMEAAGGRADGKRVSTKVKEALN